MADNAHTSKTSKTNTANTANTSNTRARSHAEKLAASGIDLDALYHPTLPHDFDHERPIWNEILNGLYQGGTYDSDTLGEVEAGTDMVITPDHFDTVVTLYQWANPVDWFVRELRFAFYDSNVEHFPLEQLFDLVKIAHADWKRGKRVLVRCQAGINRSGLVTALILIREGFSAAEAITMQRKQRSNWVLANRSFVDFLLGLDPEDWRGDSYPHTSDSHTSDSASSH